MSIQEHVQIILIILINFQHLNKFGIKRYITLTNN